MCAAIQSVKTKFILFISFVGNLILLSTFEMSANATGCVLKPPEKVSILPANLTDFENDYGLMSIACPTKVSGRLMACVDAMSSSDAQICVEYSENSDKCSGWTSGCLLLKEQGDEGNLFNLRVRASEVGIKCVLLEQLPQNGSDRGHVSTVNVLAVDDSLNEEETALFIAHILLVCFMNLFVGKPHSLRNYCIGTNTFLFA